MKFAATSMVLALAVPAAASAQSATSNHQLETFDLKGLDVKVSPVPISHWRAGSSVIEVEGRRYASALRLPASTWPNKKPSTQLGSFWQNQSAVMKWETAYLALSAVDAAQTIRCLKRDTCEEANPLFGRHPSAATLIASKLGGGLLHYALITELEKRDPKLALRTAQISAGLQGGVVAMNARISF